MEVRIRTSKRYEAAHLQVLGVRELRERELELELGSGVQKEVWGARKSVAREWAHGDRG